MPGEEISIPLQMAELLNEIAQEHATCFQEYEAMCADFRKSWAPVMLRICAESAQLDFVNKVCSPAAKRKMDDIKYAVLERGAEIYMDSYEGEE